MVVKIEYENFLKKNGTSVFVTNKLGQKWEMKRVGISELEIQQLVKKIGKTHAINWLIEEGYLTPIYGGKLNL